MPTPLLLLLLLLHITLSTSTTPTNFTLHGFTNSNLTLDGSATIVNNLLTITNTSKQQTGYAFFPAPLPFHHPTLSFSTTFVFATVPMYPDVSIHGLTFFISPTTHLNSSQLARKYFGLFNDSTNGNASNHIVAVEFDLFMNPDLKDIDDNHVGIDVNGAISIASHTAGYFIGPHNFTNLTLESGHPFQAWVEYNAIDMTLDVTLAPVNIMSRPSIPLCSAKVNLSGVLMQEMYVGFSGTSGVAPLSQYVLGWSFRLNGEADALDLSRLPKLPLLKGKGIRWYLVVVLVLVTAVAVAVAMGGGYVAVKRKAMFVEVLEEWEAEYGPHRVSYKELHRATKGFSDNELVGTGGFGRVYRGVLPRSKVEVAVKRVSDDSRQGMREFVAEVVSMGRLRHRNLVQLLGYCRRKGELLLVYDYMPNGSLDRLLFDNPPTSLDWDQRIKIIKGVAAGLLYLHEEWEQVVVHRDVKASNVLLDGDHNARLGDFGLSRLYDHGTDPQTTHVIGTMGYLAPELTRIGRATKATDVFAFGIFILEVVCGRRPIDPNAPAGEIVLVDWVLRKWLTDGSKLASVADRRMRYGDDGKGDDRAVEVEMVVKLGLLCSHVAEEARPSMRQVVQLLEGDLLLPELPVEYWKGCGGCGNGGVVVGGGFDSWVVSGASSSGVGDRNASIGPVYLSGGR